MPAPPEFAAEGTSEHAQQQPHSNLGRAGTGLIGEQNAQQMTPTDTGSVHTDPDKDPFLSLLEQLAENEQSRGGPSELDFFLSASAG
jgi:hypothetical protein